MGTEVPYRPMGTASITRAPTHKGTNMSTALLSLGPFAFEGLESPEQIILRSKQRLIVHHLASGATITNSLGEDCETAIFEGIFAGTDAAARVQLIEGLKSMGAPLPLIWGTRSLLVIIQEFALNYISNQWIPYRLTCLVARSASQWIGMAVDELLVTPVTQVNDVIAMLASTGISATAPQTAALVELANQNYDVVPPAAMRSARPLGDMVNNKIATEELALRNNPANATELTGQEAQWLGDIVENVGLQAALVLARNQLTALFVSAASVNQP